MARIRSVHPGLFTDEAFVSLSDAAQIFLIGLWTEADDQGVFDWKPTTLRMRLRAAKDGPVEPLLSELEAANCIRAYEIGGRKVGAIRNFRRFQRPKTPNSHFIITDDIRSYVGLSDQISEMDRDDVAQFPRKGEKSPQMEGRRKGMEGGEKGRREPEAVQPLVPSRNSNLSSHESSARARDAGALSSGSSLGLEGRSSPDNAQAGPTLEEKLEQFRAREARRAERETAKKAAE